MEMPHADSIAYLYSELEPKLFLNEETHDKAERYLLAQEMFEHDYPAIKLRTMPIVSLSIYSAPGVVNNRISERERSQRGKFPDNAVLPNSWIDVEVQKYELVNKDEILSSIEFRQNLIFKSFDLSNAVVVNLLQEPEIDEVEYEFEDVNGFRSIEEAEGIKE